MKRKTIAIVSFAIATFLTAYKIDAQIPYGTSTFPSGEEQGKTEAVSVFWDEEADASIPWTLRDCIEYAQENNIDLRRQELSTEDATLAKKQARLNYIPALSGSLGSGTSFGRVLDPTTYQFRENSSNTDLSASLSAGTEIFAGMRKYHQLKKADLNFQDMLLRVEKTRNDLELNITAAYLEILFSEEEVAIAQKRTETLELQVEHVEKLVEAGRKTIGDLLQLQSDLADAKYQSIEAGNKLSLAYFNLCQLLEIRDFRTFRIYIPESLPVSAEGLTDTPDSILEMAQEMPQIKSAALSLDMADRDIRIAQSYLYPTLGVSAGYGTSFSNGRLKQAASGDTSFDPNDPSTYVPYPFKEQIRNNANYYISLSLSVPIFNSLSARNNVKSYRIARRRTEYDYMLAQKELNREIQQAYINAVGAYEQYEAAKKNTATSREAFRMIEEKYNLGAASPVDYSIALYNAVNAQSQLSQAKYSYIFKTKILDFYKGIPITL